MRQTLVIDVWENTIWGLIAPPVAYRERNHREVESEESFRKNADIRNINHI